MALLRGLSIKWKLSFAVIVAGLTLVTAYVFIANRVIRNDKISYVLDAQASRLESAKNEIESKFERALLGSRTVIGTFDFTEGKLSTLGERIFKEDTSLLAIELLDEEKNQLLIRLEKQPSTLPSESVNPQINTKIGYGFKPLDSGKALVTTRLENLRLRIVLDLNGILPKASATQSIALVHDRRVLAVSDYRDIDLNLFAELASEVRDSGERTRIWEKDGNSFLVNELPLNLFSLTLLALTPETEALSAIRLLFHRSVIFITLSVFGLILVSLAFARRLIVNLGILTRSAEEIGKGNFDTVPTLSADDEIGILGASFQKMSRELKRLLIETRENTRIEEDLKTANLIQMRLLPKQATATIGEIDISGIVLTSNECGGDWWHYFTKGPNLYVAIADVTGNGTSAALITAAARAVFSRLENENLSLKEMMHAWDHAIASCSQNEVFMTGLLLRLNTQTGEGAFVNAAHTPPYIMRENPDGTFSPEFLLSGASSRLGEGSTGKFSEKQFQLGPNEAILLYTDGLFSIERAGGRPIGERRFGIRLATRAEFARNAKQLTEAALRTFNEHRSNLPLPDDVTIVSIRRTGPERKTFLENDCGALYVSN